MAWPKSESLPKCSVENSRIAARPVNAVSPGSFGRSDQNLPRWPLHAATHDSYIRSLGLIMSATRGRVLFFLFCEPLVDMLVELDSHAGGVRVAVLGAAARRASGTS